MRTIRVSAVFAAWLLLLLVAFVGCDDEDGSSTVDSSADQGEVLDSVAPDGDVGPRDTAVADTREDTGADSQPTDSRTDSDDMSVEDSSADTMVADSGADSADSSPDDSSDDSKDTAESCGQQCTGQGFTCCGDSCVNPGNDINNCGECGTVCTGPAPFCDNGVCSTPPCATTCPDANCCNDACCGAGQICCVVPGSLATPALCTDPTEEDSCPMGCLTCVCASPDTPIATPLGEIPIASIRTGDLVFSMHQGSLQAVPVLRTNRIRAHNHSVLQILLSNLEIIEISAAHPDAGGRALAELRPGDKLGELYVLGIRSIPYEHEHTYDILPDSDSGSYLAAGALLGSTLSPAQR